LKSFCRKSDEFTLYSCIEKLERNAECCSNAKTHDCLQICQQMLFNKSGSFRNLADDLNRSCKENNLDVIDCIHDNINTKTIENHEDLLPCCHSAPSGECKELCFNKLNLRNVTESEILDAFEAVCGTVNLSSDFWTCFLNGKNQAKNIQNTDVVSRIKQIGIDSAKLLCCEKAQNTQCRRGCFYSFSGNHALLSKFQSECLQNNHESELKRCIEEVDQPAEVGCDGLSFCTNFNNRPTELFRSCNPIADQSARNELAVWKQQTNLVFSGFNFPVLNITTCSPKVWHAIACILQLKPTTKLLHLNQICWDDCFDILSRCMDWKRMESQEILPEKICSNISPDRKAPCISIKPYLEPSDSVIIDNKITIASPCRGQQCNATSEVCEVDRNNNKPACTQGCSVGEASNYIIPINSYVRIPFSVNKGCYKVCKCIDGKIEKCQPLPCVAPRSCQIGNRTLEHGQSISIECNICTCFSEEITCTKKQCHIPEINDRFFTTLPCNCPPHYIPVCAKNGRTYPSPCIAKCVGFHETEFESGSCESKNPCESNACKQGYVCFPYRNVCLSNMHTPCPQYQCG
jgi:reversion-inducing-cysteine-rich protein with kazal motifs